MTASIGVILVDDHRVLVQGLALVLDATPDIRLLGTGATVAEAERLASLHAPDVAVVDFRLPDGTGAEAARRIRRRARGVAVLMLSADTADEAMLAALEAGACGYLPKTKDAEEVVEAIRRAARGETVLPAGMMARLLGRQRASLLEERERERVEAGLTPREREVLALMAEGLDNGEIAVRLGIGRSTVRGHVQHVLEKVGAHSKLAAVVRAGQLGLLKD